MKRILCVALIAAGAVITGAACERRDATDTARAAGPRVIEMRVTNKGFEPKDVSVKAGEPLELRITRKTETTCATEIVLEGVTHPLPLDETVTVAFTPASAGQLRYGCAMDKMIGGVITVQ